MPLTQAEQAELENLEVIFGHLGGRSVEIAEDIDRLRAKRDRGKQINDDL